MSHKSHKIAVLGGGSFGTAIANMLASNAYPVVLWMRNAQHAQQVQKERVNQRYLPGYKLAQSLQVSADLNACLQGVDTIFFAVPSGALQDLASQVSSRLEPEALVISTSKGICGADFMLPSQILEAAMPDVRIGVMSGPNLAKEIADYEITATVVASEDPTVCATIQRMLASNYFRVYANHDRFGVELAGALKNIYAIVAGIAEALKAGQNTKSVVLTRSLAEMRRFGTQLGADPMTFLGLSGVGDLYVTCTSPLSRNYQVGLALGEGKSLAQSVADVGQIAEGVNTTRLVKEKADSMGIYMPLASALYATLFEKQSIQGALRSMMLAEQNSDVDFMVTPNER